MLAQRFEPVTGRAPRPLFVGRRRYGIPASSQAVFPNGERLAYLRTAGGRIFVLTESGEVEAPAEQGEELTQEFFSTVPLE